MLTELVNGADVGVVQRRGCLRFMFEALQCVRVGRRFAGQKLDGDSVAQLEVLGAIDHTHTAAADYVEHAVMRNRLA